MIEEEPRSSLLAWVVGTGIALVLTVGASGYIIANPGLLSGLFGEEPAPVSPVTSANGSPPAPPRVPAPHTKHYENMFFSFDYPEEFAIESELTNVAIDENGGRIDAFGSSEITLVATGDASPYRIKVTSRLNKDHRDPALTTMDARESFSARPERGPNDSFQDITVGLLPAYKDFSSGRIHIGVPSSYLDYDVEIVWSEGSGQKSTANSLLGAIEDSFSPR